MIEPVRDHRYVQEMRVRTALDSQARERRRRAKLATAVAQAEAAMRAAEIQRDWRTRPTITFAGSNFAGDCWL